MAAAKPSSQLQATSAANAAALRAVGRSTMRRHAQITQGATAAAPTRCSMISSAPENAKATPATVAAPTPTRSRRASRYRPHSAVRSVRNARSPGAYQRGVNR